MTLLGVNVIFNIRNMKHLCESPVGDVQIIIIINAYLRESKHVCGFFLAGQVTKQEVITMETEVLLMSEGQNQISVGNNPSKTCTLG